MLYYILSIYSPFSDRVDFLFITLFLDIFSVDLKFCHIRFYTLYPCPSWSSNRSSASAFNFKLHTFLYPVLITCLYHLRLPLLMTVVIGSTPPSFLNSSLVFLSFMETPHIHLIICISADQTITRYQLARA